MRKPNRVIAFLVVAPLLQGQSVESEPSPCVAIPEIYSSAARIGERLTETEKDSFLLGIHDQDLDFVGLLFHRGFRQLSTPAQIQVLEEVDLEFAELSPDAQRLVLQDPDHWPPEPEPAPAPHAKLSADLLSRWKGKLPTPSISRRFGDNPYDRYEARRRQRASARAAAAARVLAPLGTYLAPAVGHRPTSRLLQGYLLGSSIATGQPLHFVDPPWRFRPAPALYHPSPWTLYEFSDGTHGSSHQLGPWTLYDFSDGTHGSSHQLGPWTLYDFSDGTSASSVTLGP